MAEPHVWARPLTPEFAEDFFKLHDRGDCGGCYCMYWHFPGPNDSWRTADPKALRAEKAARIVSRGDTGMILYEDQAPIGWCQFGPRKLFPKIVEGVMPPEGAEDLWCISCFLVAPEKRRQGYGRVLLAISLEHLTRLGVKEVEAYPRAGRCEDGEVWNGPLKLFLDAGFREVVGGGDRRVVRKRLF
jgi:GNAT superfamily N-acetyltransferase